MAFMTNVKRFLLIFDFFQKNNFLLGKYHEKVLALSWLESSNKSLKLIANSRKAFTEGTDLVFTFMRLIYHLLPIFIVTIINEFGIQTPYLCCRMGG